MFENYKRLLSEFVSIPSVSTDPAFALEAKRAADWLEVHFRDAGFKVDRLTASGINPVVVARYNAGLSSTTLIYGHYDVQPATMEQGWTSDPFKLRESDSRFYARGVADNKGQILIHMANAFELIKRGQLRSNLIFVVEGNEETGNPAIGKLLEANRHLVECDEILISDGELVGEHPELDASLRGGANLRVSLRTAKSDLHSGVAGGAVPNAAKVMADLLASLFDEKGAVKVPYFYDGMSKTGQTRKRAGSQPTAKDFGVKQLLPANAANVREQVGEYPTLQVTGLSSGYNGAGFANIVPATAEARLNLRTVVGQDSKKIATEVAGFLEKAAPKYAEIKVEITDTHRAVKLDTESPNAKRVKKLLKEIYGKEAVDHHVGGAIPVVADLQQLFGPNILMVGLANSDCSMHGANENFRIDLIKKGLKFSQAWFSSTG